MWQATGEYWDSDRATYEDELNAFRERTAAPIDAPIVQTVSQGRRPVRRPSQPISGQQVTRMAPRLRRTRRQTTRRIAA